MSSEPAVAVVDADESTQQAVRSIVQTMNFQCEVFASGRDFLQSKAIARPGCAVLEVRVPEISGLTIQEQLRERNLPLPVIFLTSHATVSIAVRAMRNGAAHFLEKPFREHELWDAIKEAVAEDARRRQAWRKREDCERRMEALTEKERSVVELIALGRSNREIAEEMGVCLRTVELRRREVMKKLKLKTLLQLVHFAALAVNGHSNGEAAAEHRAFQPLAR
jgi:FixJ family two-component response regulator